MIGLPKRLRASLRCDAINGDSFERSVCAKQMREAADSLERADARIAELEQAVTDRNAKLAQLQGELELARRDAERYRWLRDHDESPRGARDVYASIHDWSMSLDPTGRFNMWSHVKVSGQHLDAAIDEARAGNGESGDAG